MLSAVASWQDFLCRVCMFVQCLCWFGNLPQPALVQSQLGLVPDSLQRRWIRGVYDG